MLSPADVQSGSRMVFWTRSCLGTICAVMVIWFLANIYDGRQNIGNEASVEARHQAKLFADQVSRGLHSLDNVLTTVAGRVENRGIAYFETPEGSQLLRDMAGAVPLDTIFWVFQPNGVAIAASIDISKTTVKIADRDYYKKIVSTPGTELVVGKPVTGKVSGAVILPIARAVRSPTGDLVAIVSTSLRLSSVNEAYRSFLTGGLNTMELKRADTGEQVFSITEFDDGDGADRRPSDVAGERVHASERIDGYPLVSHVGVYTAPWTGRWKREVILQGVWLTVGLLLSFLLYWTVVREARVLGKNAVLLTEVHHRVKNNLAIIQSLLIMEANRAPPEARRGYDDSVARVEAMGLVHNLIYDHQRFEGIALDDYLRRLCAAIGGPDKRLHITIDAAPIEVPLDTAVPLALITNEIITNSIKHAAKPDRDGEVVVTLRRRSKHLMLSIRDNGPGLPENAINGLSDQLGLKIVRQLTRQLKGDSWFDNEDGARFTLVFDDPLTA